MLLLVVKQFYEAEVNNEYVIRGNAAVLKCSIPSFVADFVSVQSWQDDSGNTYSIESSSSVENGTISKLINFSYPLFPHVQTIFHFTFTEKIIFHNITLVVNQYYEAEVVSEYVIRGNTAVLKCNIPSFVADFVKVEAWVGSEGSEFIPSQDFGNLFKGSM